MRPITKPAGRFSPAFLFNQSSLHPAVKIVLFVLMAVCIPYLKWPAMLGLALLLAFILICYRVSSFIPMMLRMRWLFVSMLLIFAYTTPGEFLAHWPIAIAPSYEGLHDGLFQIARISLALAGIALLMHRSSKEHLMAGIYTIIKPLSILRLSPERFTARLYLTLQYIDKTKQQHNKQDQASSWQERFQALLSDSQEIALSETVHLEMPAFTWLDVLCVLVLLILTALLR